MTIAEGNVTQYDVEEEDFGSLMLESGVCGYLYKPHSEEQPRQKTCLSRTRSPDWLELHGGGLVAPVISLCNYEHRDRVRLLQRI